MVERGLSMRSWCHRSGLSANVLTELFSGRTRSLKYATLARLAAAEGASPSDLVSGDILVRVSDVASAVATWAAGCGIADPTTAAAEVVGLLSLAPGDS